MNVNNNSIISTAQYFGANIVLLAISTSLTVIVLNVHHRGSLGNPVPPLVRLVVLDWLAKMLGLRKRMRKHNKKQVSDATTVQHYDDVIMTMLASQISSLPVVCSIVYSDVNQRKHQSSASLAFVREIHRGPVNFPHKWPVTRKMFPFDDVIMSNNIE